MADPVTAGLVLSAATATASGVAARESSRGEQERAEVNSFIGRTRANQTDTTARLGLEDQLGSIRNALGDSGQRSGSGTLDVINEIREVRDRERRIGVGNENVRAADFARQGRNAGRRGNRALALGVIKAGPSLFDLAQL